MKVVERKLCKIRVSEDKGYAASRRSPRLVEVLEQGSKVIHRQRVSDDPHAEYLIERGWLVERSYPGITKALADFRAREKASARKHAAIERSSEFRAMLEELQASDRGEDGGLGMWTCEVRHNRDVPRLMKRVESCCGAATYRSSRFSSMLCIIAGSAVRFAALLLLEVAEPDKLLPALEALDAESKISFPRIGSRGDFDLRLAAPPKNAAKHAKALARALDYPERDIAKGLRAGAWSFSNY